MQIRTFYRLNNSVYSVEIRTEDWSQGDQDLMSDFGEPEIDLGGDFTGTTTYSLPNNLVRVLSESPFTQAFDARDNVDAKDRADDWADTIQARLGVAVTTLRSNTDDYSREEVETV